ncbi:MAG: SURF1 family protein, partial [Wolbachia pipientis]|nr:SURF1 family protein [Wolbachia pipientis]
MLKRVIFILIIPCLLFFSLGLWQLYRLYWKSNIIKSMSLPVVHLLFNDDFAKFNYRRVKIDGILSDMELYVFVGRHGYYILSPMILTTGYYMLVNEGIVKERKKKRTRSERVVVNGILYCDNVKGKGWLIKNDAALNMWFTLSIEEISDELGIKLEKCMLWQEDFSNKLTMQPVKHLE